MTQILNNTLALLAAAFITAALFVPTASSGPAASMLVAAIA
ncbi:hypothetical protein [Altererythrobacter sp. ZODW24]|nr:hypothetical protein [Altererythrobacter sp. ZODW24]